MNKLTVKGGEIIWLHNFEEWEFACKCRRCGDGANKMDPDFMRLLQAARTIAGVGFSIISGYRCPDHNRAVRSTSLNHPMGMAADIRATTSPVRGKILVGLVKAGFTRIGIHQTFIHADSRVITPDPACWIY